MRKIFIVSALALLALSVGRAKAQTGQQMPEPEAAPTAGSVQATAQQAPETTEQTVHTASEQTRLTQLTVSQGYTLAPSDTSAAAPAGGLRLEDEASATAPQEVTISDDGISLDNDLSEMSLNMPLPEVRFVTIGVSIGGGMSMYPGAPGGADATYSMRGGLNFDVPIGRWFSVQPELLLTARGGGFSQNGIDFKEHLLWADIPINCKASTRLNISQKLSGRPFVSAGPVLCIGLGGTGKAKGGDKGDQAYHPLQNDPDEETEHALYRNFDLGLNFRLGYDLDMGLSVAIGYQMGLLELLDDGDYDEAETKYYNQLMGGSLPSFRSSALYLQVGYCW